MDLTPLGPDNVAVAEPATEVAWQGTDTEVSAQTASRDSGQRVLKRGYKQTELGVIPEDWEVRKLGEKAHFRTGPFGSTLHKSDYTVDGIPVINPMHIMDGKLAPSRIMTIIEDAARQLSEFRLRAGDIVIGRRGDMGRCAVVQENQAGWLCGTGSLIIHCAEGVTPDYLQRVLSSAEVVSAIENASVGSTMINLNQGVLSGLSIQLPPLPEQRAIAAALSDVDALLTKFDALIAKKRDVKQAAMQQLLTGKQRLPGFSEEWVVKRLDNITLIVGGGTPKTSVHEYWNGGVAWCTPTDITASSGKYLETTAKTISPAGMMSSAANLLPPESLLLCSRATIGELKIARFPVCTNQGFKSLICKPDVSCDFLYYKLLTLKSKLIEKASGSTFLEISKKDVAGLEIDIPLLSEQTAIAAVLSDMDTELAALETRRDKTRALKQGMMQNLLTGRIRLQ